MHHKVQQVYALNLRRTTAGKFRPEKQINYFPLRRTGDNAHNVPHRWYINSFGAAVLEFSLYNIRRKRGYQDFVG